MQIYNRGQREYQVIDSGKEKLIAPGKFTEIRDEKLAEKLIRSYGRDLITEQKTSVSVPGFTPPQKKRGRPPANGGASE